MFFLDIFNNFDMLILKIKNIKKLFYFFNNYI